MMVINSFKRKPAVITAILSLFSVCYLFWPHHIQNHKTTIQETLSHPSLMNHPNLQYSTVQPAWTNTTRANAAFVILTRNSELDQLRRTIHQLEARFNHKFNYPYVFLNDEEFTDEFKDLTSSLTKAETKYGLIDKEFWSYPEWIDIAKADRLRQEMEDNQILYGGSLSYRHMCRFESGFFYRHPLMMDFDYYWRVEPGVEFSCDIDYDPFLFMKDNGKKYGWTISLLEFKSTIPTLWDTVKSFIREYPQMIPEQNLMDFISDFSGIDYNLCHFWSNFEIGDLNFFRSPEYTAYFDYLDKAGGFFYERWGDAPVHSIAVSLFLNKSQVHFFDDIGYKHDPFMHCPSARELQKKCHCNAEESFDYSGSSCYSRWVAVQD